MWKSSLQLGTDWASVKSFPDFLGLGPIRSFSISSVRTLVLVAVVGTSRQRRSPRRWTQFGSRWRWSSLLSISPSAMLWLLLLLRCCAHEDLLSQSWSRSRFQRHLFVVVVAIRLGRLRLGCTVVVVVGLCSQSWSLTKQ